MSAPAREQITGLVLAGGRGSRMGGVAKGLQVVHGRPLLAHVLERLQPQVGPLLINANQELARHAQFGWPVIADSSDDYLGPLAGILAGLRACESDWLLCVPCDSPRLPRNLAARLSRACTEAQADLAYAVCEGQAQPVFCLLRPHLADSAAQFLAEGGRKLERWQQMQAHCALHFDQPSDAAAFVNLNSLSELHGLNPESPENPNHG